ncbi:DUF7738 domain-containing protein [Enterovibrio calviensis]|uniref:DUF7738 domain-containing protein n=1 Tax=Enterovibrio calviensis TaxID=91359 RepID=UPI000482A828|nr:hypothetical protein [Enterovibrio calviensis]
MKIRYLITIALFLLSGCFSETEASNKPIRLVISGDQITIDGKALSFEEPLKEWIEVLGDGYLQGNNGPISAFYMNRFIYPELGIDLEVQLNYSDVKSDWIDGEVGTLKDPYNRFVSVVRISMNPESKANPSDYRYLDKEEAEHPYYTMYADYAIDFYGAIVDSDTSIESVLSQSNIVKRNRKFHASVGVYSGYENLGNIVFNHFFGEQPEVSMSMEVWPTLELRLENERRYFGKVVTR